MHNLRLHFCNSQLYMHWFNVIKFGTHLPYLAKIFLWQSYDCPHASETPWKLWANLPRMLRTTFQHQHSKLHDPLCIPWDILYCQHLWHREFPGPCLSIVRPFDQLSSLRCRWVRMFSVYLCNTQSKHRTSDYTELDRCLRVIHDAD